MFNFLITFSLQNSVREYIYSDKDDEKILKWIDNNSHIRYHLLANHKISTKHRHSHLLIFDERCANKKPSYVKNCLRKSLKILYKLIPKNNKVWLDIRHIKNYSFESAYLLSPDDSKLIVNNSPMKKQDFDKDLVAYYKAKAKKDAAKFKEIKGSLWTFCHNYISKNSIKINSMEDINKLEETLFFSGIYINQIRNKNQIMNDVLLYYTKDKDHYKYIHSYQEHFNPEELEKRKEFNPDFI